VKRRRLNPWRGLRGLSREVWIVCAANLINRTGTMALPFLVLYLTRHLGFSPGRAGLAVTAYGIGAMITGPLAGRLCDRVGAVRIMRYSLFVSGMMLAAFPWVRGMTAILVASFLLAVTNEAFRPANLAALTQFITPEQRKAGFALNRLAINLGMSVGPAAGGFLAMISFPSLFWIDGATSILAGIFLIALWRAEAERPAPILPAGESARVPGGFSGLLADRRLIYFLLALLPILLVFFQHVSTMPLFLVHGLHLSEGLYGILFTLNTAIVILIEVPLNSAMAGWSHRSNLALGTFLVGSGFAALAFASNFATAAATVVVWTFGEMILLPGTAAYVAEIAPPGRQGEYMGLYTMTFSIAFAIGPSVGTQILERFGAIPLWSAVFVAGCLSTAMMARIPGRPVLSPAGAPRVDPASEAS
jgi:predicted MFS family arabinose efflux permease